MHIRHLMLPLLLAMPAYAEAEELKHPEPGSSLPRPPLTSPSRSGPPTSWLGLDLDKPDHTLVTHLPALPAGVGFIVKTVHTGGPAANAGLQETDLLWKLNDQLLINEAQLSTLLRLYQPGEAITLTVFRSGGEILVPLTLGQNPGPAQILADTAAEDAVLLNENGPMRVVNMAERQAFIANADGRAVVRKVNDGYWLTIENADGDVIHDASFDRSSTSGCERDDAIPSEWKRRAYALRRGLDHALERSITSPRTPRPRVTQPAIRN